MKKKQPAVTLLSNDGRYMLLFRRELMMSMIERGYRVTLLCPRFAEESEIRDLGVEYEAVDLKRGSLNILNDLRFYKQVRRLLERIGPALQINYSVKCVLYGSLAAHRAGVKRIYSMITGLGYAFIGKDILNLLIRFYAIIMYRLVLPLNRKVFFLNADDLKVFTDYKLVRPYQAAILNGEGVNLQKFSPGPRKEPGPVAFLFVGRLLKDKGIHEYVAAARVVKSQFKDDVVFRIVGGLHENPRSLKKNELDRLVREQVVEYVGHMADVRPELARADVFVLPSYREGLPISTLEAMATGLPVITTDVPGCRETVIPGENGILVTVRDVDSLVQAMRMLAGNANLRRKMGERSLAIVRERFEISRVIDQIFSALELEATA
ncbi:MAG: glycosyltransferase family 4 protein [Spirochaetales bacterium]|nr:glycosyltransferase family 4 protein [Spirochaetales bacterium]